MLLMLCPAQSSVQYRVGHRLHSLASAQECDEELNTYRTAGTKLKLEAIPFGPQQKTLLCDVSLGHPRPIVPPTWRKRVFEDVHNLSHPSIRATRTLVTKKFVWHGISKDVNTWAKTCASCQKAKVQRHVKAPLAHFKVSIRCFDHINIDLVGPFAPSQGFTHLFTVVDRFTRWPEAIPLSDISATSCAQALIRHWISRFGVPNEISSDHGAQFTSNLWAAVAQSLSTKHSRTTAYHPQANGLVERFHRHMKAVLMARLSGANWMDELP